MGKKMINEY
jgi:[calcium/calmodulin-dependent protein kinase] kinase